MTGLSETLIGGGLAIVASVVTTVVTKVWEQNRQKEQKNLERSALAFSASVKLLEISDWYGNLIETIDDCVALAKGSQASNLEIGIQVPPLLGLESKVEKLTAAELGLVLSSKDQGLLKQVLAVEKRYSTSFVTLDCFNRLRAEYTTFVRQHSVAAEKVDGSHYRFAMNSEDRHRDETFVNQLNGLIEDLIKAIKDDYEQSKATVLRVQTALRSLEGVDVQVWRFDEGPKQNALS